MILGGPFRGGLVSAPSKTGGKRAGNGIIVVKSSALMQTSPVVSTRQARWTDVHGSPRSFPTARTLAFPLPVAGEFWTFGATGAEVKGLRQTGLFPPSVPGTLHTFPSIAISSPNAPTPAAHFPHRTAKRSSPPVVPEKPVISSRPASASRRGTSPRPRPQLFLHGILRVSSCDLSSTRGDHLSAA